jgi:hypothetical protein
MSSVTAFFYKGLSLAADGYRYFYPNAHFSFENGGKQTVLKAAFIWEKFKAISLETNPLITVVTQELQAELGREWLQTMQLREEVGVRLLLRDYLQEGVCNGLAYTFIKQIIVNEGDVDDRTLASTIDIEDSLRYQIKADLILSHAPQKRPIAILESLQSYCIVDVNYGIRDESLLPVVFANLRT